MSRIGEIGKHKRLKISRQKCLVGSIPTSGTLIMPIPFEEYKYHFFQDIRRSPFVIWTKEEVEWSKNERKRMFLLALDRYADVLQKKEKNAT